jgi:hypothetical protein
VREGEWMELVVGGVCEREESRKRYEAISHPPPPSQTGKHRPSRDTR